MSGAERAAALLVALGPKIASDIMKHLDDESIEKITREIARIDKLNPDEREDLIGEFLINLRKEKRRVQGGEEKARELLVRTFGTDKADEILNKFTEADVDKEFEYLKEIEDDILLSFIKDEHPQTIAVTMTFLHPEKSAFILKSLEKDLAKEVAIRLAKMVSVTPEAVVGIAKTIRKKYKEYLEQNQGLSTGGVDTLVTILGHMSGSDEKQIMSTLDSVMPSISGQIREKIFAFENIVTLSNQDIRVLIDEVNDDHLIAMALKGAGDDIRFKFLRNMSRNRATDILGDMDVMGPVRIKEVEDCRGAIIDIMKALHENGAISLQHGDNVLID
jgi:flagellar motor switch protein FliG